MTVPDIDDYSDVLDEHRRAIWDTVAVAARKCDGLLMGGTALAMHLRHRRSMDFDIFTTEDFYHPHVAEIFRQSGHDYDPYMVRHNSVNVSLGGVLIQIHRDTPDPDSPHTEVQLVSPPTDICGMPVASLEDAFASKLNAVRHRSTQRDLFDVYTVDTATWCKVEDGVRLHRLRYGVDAQDQILNGLAVLLDKHESDTLEAEGGGLDPTLIASAASHLRSRLSEVGAVVVRGRAGSAVPASSNKGEAPPSVSNERSDTPTPHLLKRLWCRFTRNRGATRDAKLGGRKRSGPTGSSPPIEQELFAAPEPIEVAQCDGKVKKNKYGKTNARCILPTQHKGLRRSIA